MSSPSLRRRAASWRGAGAASRACSRCGWQCWGRRGTGGPPSRRRARHPPPPGSGCSWRAVGRPCAAPRYGGAGGRAGSGARSGGWGLGRSDGDGAVFAYGKALLARGTARGRYVRVGGRKGGGRVSASRGKRNGPALANRCVPGARVSPVVLT